MTCQNVKLNKRFSVTHLFVKCLKLNHNDIIGIKFIKSSWKIEDEIGNRNSIG